MAATAETPPVSLSVNAFATRMQVNEAAVRKGIKNGRLTRSIGRDVNGRVVIVDAALAEQEWTANRAGAPLKGPDLLTMAEEKKRLTRAQARKIEMANRKQSGTLIPARAAEIRYSTMVVTAKTKLRGIPSRAKSRLPHLPVADLAVLAELIDEALEELANGQ